MKLIIDIDADVVAYEGEGRENRLFPKQWVEFYALLALLELDVPPASGVLTAEALHRVGRWAKPSFSSVGVEVSRHLKELDKAGLSSVFRPLPKTKMWRLALPAEKIILSPNIDAVQRWLCFKGWQSEPDSNLGVGIAAVSWIQHITISLFELQKGELEKSVASAASAASSTQNQLLKCISDLVLLRGLARSGASEEILDEMERIYDRISTWNEGFLSTGIRARTEAIRALSTKFSDAEAELTRLFKLTTQLHDTGDSGALGVVYNVMGILAKRKGDIALSERYLRIAIPLLALSNDLPGLQAANMNLAQVLSLEYKERPTEELAKAIDALFDIEYMIVNEHGFGRDSGQAESVAARFALQRLDLQRASKFIRLAEKICTKSQRDRAPLAWIKARYTFLSAWINGKNALATLRETLALLRNANEEYSVGGETVSRLEDEIKTIEAMLKDVVRERKSNVNKF